ncbi:hypothetical protein TRFO_35717 [Tritrichomonas foetus]|uniref:3D domain-containing protein n=1 Tax=Tritrichomonas foetus TaxID=1144522 RepID=A0A1J4JI53_9EUKA|nr:hypothetical protein TRFO_35717 [Tritrichomonas foetus]|eukprot:OHS97951.1 hypothetical protein TRFO_35717 [Tritrichomonas foetus]
MLLQILLLSKSVSCCEWWTATAYECENAPDCLTACGNHPQIGHTIACDRSLTGYYGSCMHTTIDIEGYGTYVCEDVGTAIQGNMVDIFVGSINEAINFGRQSVCVTVRNSLNGRVSINNTNIDNSLKQNQTNENQNTTKNQLRNILLYSLAGVSIFALIIIISFVVYRRTKKISPEYNALVVV